MNNNFGYPFYYRVYLVIKDSGEGGIVSSALTRATQFCGGMTRSETLRFLLENGYAERQEEATGRRPKVIWRWTGLELEEPQKLENPPAIATPPKPELSDGARWFDLPKLYAGTLETIAFRQAAALKKIPVKQWALTALREIAERDLKAAGMEVPFLDLQ